MARHSSPQSGTKVPFPARATTGRRTSAVRPGRERVQHWPGRPGPRSGAGSWPASRQRVPCRQLWARDTLASYRAAPTSAVGVALPTARASTGPPVLVPRHAWPAAGIAASQACPRRLAPRQVPGAHEPWRTPCGCLCHCSRIPAEAARPAIFCGAPAGPCSPLFPVDGAAVEVAGCSAALRKLITWASQARGWVARPWVWPAAGRIVEGDGREVSVMRKLTIRLARHADHRRRCRGPRVTGARPAWKA
jgi:hypothetical protein